MAILLSRLSKMRPDIAAFTLTVHEMCADTDPILFGKRTFFEYSADDPPMATAILFNHPEARRGADFDPLGYVLLAADALKKSPANGIFTFSAPMPSYHSEELLVTRRFECLITYRQPPFPGKTSDEDTLQESEPVTAQL